MNFFATEPIGNNKVCQWSGIIVRNQKDVSNIEQNAFTSCLEIKKRLNLSIFLYPKVIPMVVSSI